ncbi:MAG: hypothetical protein KC983_06485 [Phycisphaerales bacterium]|nr:hypothetical protein [Phycisphaerales bacterium]
MRTIGKAIGWFIGFIMRALMILVLPLLIIIAVMSVNEVAHRQTTLRQFYEARQELETTVRNLDLGPAGGPTPTLYANLREAQDQLQAARIDVHRGDPTAWTDVVARWELWRDAEEHEDDHAEANEAAEAASFSAFIEALGRIPAGTSTDVLVVVGAIASAMFGALIAGFRREDLHYLHHILLGVGAGFLVYLFVRGGRGVFFVEYEAGAIDFNAYSILLMSLLAGLFADLVFTTIVPGAGSPKEGGEKRETRRERRARLRAEQEAHERAAERAANQVALERARTADVALVGEDG